MSRLDDIREREHGKAPWRWTVEDAQQAEDDRSFLLAEVERLLTANDRLAKIASSVAVTLETGKRDLMAHGWDEGRAAAHDEMARMYGSQCEGLDCDCNEPTPNPYRPEATQ
jgi:hypothetical protein